LTTETAILKHVGRWLILFTKRSQVLHKDRVMWNLRSTDDMVRFLADATSADIQEHRDNLQRLQAERGYHKGWSWHHLRDRWGEKNLAGANVYEFMFF